MSDQTIEDGFGNSWGKQCPRCECLSMSVVRPGKVQCDSKACYMLDVAERALNDISINSTDQKSRDMANKAVEDMHYDFGEND